MLVRQTPQLKHVSPFTYFICWGYVFTNILIGLGLIITNLTTSPYVIVRGPFTYKFWGGCFIFLAILGAIALLANKWRFIRGVLVSGLILKSLWLYALMIAYSVSELTILGMFGFLAYIQFLTVVFFPKEHEK